MIEFIKQWCDKNNTLDRTITAFWNCFNVYKTDDYEEFITIFPEDKSNVNIIFERISYEFDLPSFRQELIGVYINIFVNDKKVGWFKQLFLPNGEMFDEYFVIE